MTDDHWVESGPEDDLSRGPTIPAFIETAPDHFKRVEKCSADELRGEADARMLQARALMDDAERLYELASER